MPILNFLVESFYTLQSVQWLNKSIVLEYDESSIKKKTTFQYLQYVRHKFHIYMNI